MAEVTSGLICEVLKSMRDRLGRVETTMGEMRSELQSVRLNAVAMQQDLMNTYSMLGRHETRLDRIARRLESREPVLT